MSPSPSTQGRKRSGTKPRTLHTPSSISSPAIEVRDVEKVFAANSSHSVQALNHVSMSIAPGEIVALLGTNGAGKSTLIDLILGLTGPSSGTVRVLGKSPREAINNAQLAAVLQSGGLLPELTVSDTLKMISATFAQPLDIGEVAHGPDPQMVDTLKPASRWGSEVPFHHATQDLH
ncbi:ATP-binding cassette domain-containing protein [Corynebacterium sp. LaCa78]|uniref:ATP-binding cassette domain-containing protein n=1 Tax=Corynebacterium sp. LaCa78 TaxID=3391430 RepID=UPI003989638E